MRWWLNLHLMSKDGKEMGSSVCLQSVIVQPRQIWIRAWVRVNYLIILNSFHCCQHFKTSCKWRRNMKFLSAVFWHHRAQSSSLLLLTGSAWRVVERTKFQCNPAVFWNRQRKWKLVWEIRKFEKSRVKIICNVWLRTEGDWLLVRVIGDFERVRNTYSF